MVEVKIKRCLPHANKSGMAGLFAEVHKNCGYTDRVHYFSRKDLLTRPRMDLQNMKTLSGPTDLQTAPIYLLLIYMRLIRIIIEAMYTYEETMYRKLFRVSEKYVHSNWIFSCSVKITSTGKLLPCEILPKYCVRIIS